MKTSSLILSVLFLLLIGVQVGCLRSKYVDSTDKESNDSVQKDQPASQEDWLRKANDDLMRDHNEAAKRLKKFKEEIKKAKDPVALAIVQSMDDINPKAGMDVLVEYWQDPRSEQTLETIANSGPRSLGDGLLTKAGKAKQRLDIVRAKKEHHELLSMLHRRKKRL